ncbi:MAG: response regulator transcription factor [Terrimicrobiaceae bacterium]
MRARKRTLLFVDDDPEMHAGMHLILGDDYDLTCVFSGDDAIVLSSLESFPVVILDLLMPGLSGLETLKHLQDQNELQKVIILTGNDTKANAIDALNHGAFRFLIKPFEIGDLHGSLRDAFARYKRDSDVRGKKISYRELLRKGLSHRQSEIALLVIQGETNQEIGEQLGISQRTVEKHMQMIFIVLNVTSRAKVAAKFSKGGLQT